MDNVRRVAKNEKKENFNMKSEWKRNKISMRQGITRIRRLYIIDWTLFHHEIYFVRNLNLFE